MSGRGRLGKKSDAQSTTVFYPRRDPPKITWSHLWPSEATKDALAQSIFQKLPTEVILKIFQSLSVHELGQVSLVCRLFKMIADQDEIWKLKSNSKAKLHSKSFKEIYMEWMYEKYLRNIELEQVEAMYLEESSHVACGLRCSPPLYPTRPAGHRAFVPIGEFKHHPNESQEMFIELSVDVDKTARELLSLLEKASKFQAEWRQSSIIKQMFTRYYRFMQLKAAYPTTLLVPTLDIEVVWQTHLIRPQMYRDDCMRLFHRIIDHSLITSDIEQFLKDQAFLDTCHLYQERFGEEYCPIPKEKKSAPKYEHHVFSRLKCIIPVYSYWDETHYTFSSKLSTDDNPFSFTEADFILDGNWLDLCKKYMMEMLSNVPVQSYYGYSEKIDVSTRALKRLKKSYERFLYMAMKYPPANGYGFVHPTYAIDIMWHSHMQEPLKYTADCMRLVGYVIDHAPWPSVNQKEMKESCDETMKAWKKEFQNDMSTDHLYNTIGDGYEWWSD